MQISAPVIENLVQEQVLKLLKNSHYIRESSIDELNVLNDKQKTITLDNVNVLPFIQALIYNQSIEEIIPSEEINNIVVLIKLSKAKDGATAIIGSLGNSSDSDAQHILETVKLSFRCHQSLQAGEFRSPEHE